MDFQTPFLDDPLLHDPVARKLDREETLRRIEQQRKEAEQARMLARQHIETDAISRLAVAQAIARQEYVALSAHLRHLTNILDCNAERQNQRANYSGQASLAAALSEQRQRKTLEKIETVNLTPAPVPLTDSLEDTEKRLAIKIAELVVEPDNESFLL